MLLRQSKTKFILKDFVFTFEETLLLYKIKIQFFAQSFYTTLSVET
jgi:hypothetical protein